MWINLFSYKIEINHLWLNMVCGLNMVMNDVKVFFHKRLNEMDGLDVKLDSIYFSTLTIEDNNWLMTPIFEIEIEDVIWQCESTKSPSPDGSSN